MIFSWGPWDYAQRQRRLLTLGLVFFFKLTQDPDPLSVVAPEVCAKNTVNTIHNKVYGNLVPMTLRRTIDPIQWIYREYHNQMVTQSTLPTCEKNVKKTPVNVNKRLQMINFFVYFIL